MPYHSDPSNRDRWIDLFAFLGVLALGGALLVFGHVTAASLATICAALGGLYAVWRHLHSNGPPPGDGKGKSEPRP
jgi:hypothetical protein